MTTLGALERLEYRFKEFTRQVEDDREATKRQRGSGAPQETAAAGACQPQRSNGEAV